ncbi:hypothetical protein [Streptomyces sp. NRRL S-350]|uniref:hypothetical protein n=1 Tax=Streptomyces sp. NRRL S-350 TaxID=1463902 RepID=UPI0004BE80E4|nr:hypothetical protein [Streptomyces sp. NRRL S-350]
MSTTAQTPATGTADPGEREFVIVGRDGAGYTLWDAAPAPTDPVRRARVLEELGVEAMDALGRVDTARGATAREAVDRLLARLGLALAPDSDLTAYQAS